MGCSGWGFIRIDRKKERSLEGGFTFFTLFRVLEIKSTFDV